jgi:hypothetical protein
MQRHRGKSLECCNKVNALKALFNHFKIITHDTRINNLVI